MSARWDFLFLIVTYLWITIVVLHFPVALVSLVLFDQIVRTEYFDHRSAWEADGQPHGFFWVPSECIFAAGLLVRFGSVVSHRQVWRSWLFSTPGWINRDRRARLILRCWRGVVFGWLALIVSFFLILIFRPTG